jgi:hypothetical protein
VDNGSPWGSAGDRPTDLSLGLIGLGVDVIWDPARRPQANGVVERSQGTGKRWGEPQTCAGADERQRRLEELDRIQREAYPSVEKSRWQTHPGLRRIVQPYSGAWEAETWDLGRVPGHLANATAVRQVDRKGQVSIDGRNHSVGERYQGREVRVFLDPADREGVFATPEGYRCVASQPRSCRRVG